MKPIGIILAMSWMGLWLTPDQQGQRLLNAQKFGEAARTFEDPMRQGVAWYRDGEFEKASQAFSRVSSPEASFNRGNCWMLLGKYDQASSSYDEALEQRPGWAEAQENRELAARRAELVKSEGGDFGDQRIGADEIVFDKSQDSGGQNTEVASEQATSDASVQAVWLRRVQTEPADFLKSKFAYQQARQSESVKE